MGFAPFDRAPRNVGTGLPAKFAGRKNAKDRPLQNRETPRQFNFSGDKTGCGDAALPCDRATSSNGFVSEDDSDQVGAATMPRNKSQQFRPAGTRVALPGTNAAHRIARAAFAGRFVLRFFPRSDEATSRENFLRHQPA